MEKVSETVDDKQSGSCSSRMKCSKKRLKRSELTNLSYSSGMIGSGVRNKNGNLSQSFKQLKRCPATAKMAVAESGIDTNVEMPSLSVQGRQGSGESAASLDTGSGHDTDVVVSPILNGREQPVKEPTATGMVDCLMLVLAMKKRELFRDPTVQDMLRQITMAIKND